MCKTVFGYFELRRTDMKIIIFTASTGGGHKRAAAAIEAKIKAVSPDTKVKVIDAMKTIGRV